MINVKNNPHQYGWLAVVLHWTMAVLIIGLIALGFYMVRIPISLTKLKLFGYHKEFGMLVLLLVTIRLPWRWLNTIPTLPDLLPSWQVFSARLMHRLFYFFMIAVPLTGWFITSTAGLPASFFGLFVFPDLLSASKSSMPIYISIHYWLSYLLLGAIIIHSGAALLHHLYYKDDVLRRMLP